MAADGNDVELNQLIRPFNEAVVIVFAQQQDVYLLFIRYFKMIMCS